MFACQAPELAAVRLRHLNQFVNQTTAYLPSWGQLYNSADTPEDKVPIILNAANYFPTGSNQLRTRNLLANWLTDIKNHHPTYSKTRFQQGIGTLNFYR